MNISHRLYAKYLMVGIKAKKEKGRKVKSKKRKNTTLVPEVRTFSKNWDKPSSLISFSRFRLFFPDTLQTCEKNINKKIRKNTRFRYTRCGNVEEMALTTLIENGCTC